MFAETLWSSKGLDFWEGEQNLNLIDKEKICMFRTMAKGDDHMIG